MGVCLRTAVLGPSHHRRRALRTGPSYGAIKRRELSFTWAGSFEVTVLASKLVFR